MAIEYVDTAPNNIIEDSRPQITGEDIDSIVEIFNTPLTGSYNWDYDSADNRIRKLYELGKRLNWNASIDVDWAIELDKTEPPMEKEFNPYSDYPDFLALSREEQLRFGWHNQAWTLSQFLHGEQGALLVASQLVSCAPTYEAKLYAASQTFDEARHVEVFAKYLNDKVAIRYPVNKPLKLLLDKILTDPRWDLKFIGMQIIIEGLALAAFNTVKITCRDPLLKNIIHLVLRDEARHVSFGVNYLEAFVQSLSEQKKEERAKFAYEACCVMRERLIATDVFEHFGWDVEAARSHILKSDIMVHFRKLLFTRIVPNLKRIGLLPESFRDKYDALGILEFENLTSDAVIDWEEMAKPLYEDVDTP
ncbi:ferritin-like domain-containing protein [Microbulbifer spongiae]|uniref:Ferritin-like domain-containing protein n=1 Tax=Microbulbifer spongiae TaxID=2944933 RepID=A0ABY9ED87_9GAMM|nr:ferritin-like domain-containing protein [Microbulbifer sp. MI-G]WKD49951.1 ferritin-like domain-containing protein [Microbulbifer sp. MI-G]